MPLKPSDIEHKTFSTALRGYDLGEVDDFLDEVIGTIRDLEERVAALQSNRPMAAQPSVEPVDEATSVGRALIVAQETADRIVSEAREEADRVLSEARTEADQIRGEARAEADTLEAEREAVRQEALKSIAELSDRAARVRSDLAALAGVATERVDEMDMMLEEAQMFFSGEGSDVPAAEESPETAHEPGGGEMTDSDAPEGAPVESGEDMSGSEHTGDDEEELSGDSDDFDDDYGSEDSIEDVDSEDGSDSADETDSADDTDDDVDSPETEDPDFEPWDPRPGE
jgi:cell division initiation protein